jgi:hypothetical protein
MTNALYAEAGYLGQYNERLAIVLGLVTLLFLTATFASCRSCVAILNRLGWKDPSGNPVYRALLRYHAYYWWGFCFVLLLHGLVGMMHGLSVPASIDPDSYLHVPIIWLGVGSFALAAVVFSSCRSLVAFVDVFRSRPALATRRYSIYYRYHSYGWLLLALGVAGHFAVAYYHSGLWP